MFSSIPNLTPRDAHNLWYQHRSTFALSSTSHPLAHEHNPPSPSYQNVHRSGIHSLQSPRPRSNIVTPLQQLALDEQAVAKRKLQIAHFGSTWIHPVGVQKTLQAELDEIAEREDAEDQPVSTVARTQDNAVIPLIQNQVAGEVEDEEGGAERDLDADIPEAGNLDEDEEDLEAEEGDEAGSEEEYDEEEDDEEEDVEEEEDDEEEDEKEEEKEEEEYEEEEDYEEDDEADQLENGETEPRTPPPRATGEGSQRTESLATDSSPLHTIVSNNDHLGPQGEEVMDAKLRALGGGGLSSDSMAKKLK
ncbi:RuvB-like protein 2 [Rhizina undulata]